jgi:tripartite-type tricarboxylate transporter receptor subunit TctC
VTLAGPYAAIAADAQPYPNRPIRFVVPYQPGGSSDLAARIIGQKLSESLGQPVVIDNRPGAGANLGTEIVAKAAPDGYTLLLGSTGPNAVNATLFTSLPFDPLTSFVPISLVSTSTSFLTVNLDVPVRSVPELIALAKSSPTELTYGSAGNGSSPHIAGEVFKAMTGVKMTHIPYKSSPPGLVDLVGGRIQVMFPSGANALSLIKTGKIRVLAVTSASRSTLLPDVPTIAEAGLPGYEVVFWFGVLAPAGTPPEIVAKLNSEINKILKMPDVREKMTATGDFPQGSTPEEFMQLIRTDITRWGKVVKDSGAKVD